jgi:multidrug efflux pump subunit AcrB
MELTQAFDFVTPVEEEYDGSLNLLYEGAILAVLVVWLFLRDWRATFVSAVALPMSVIPAFVGMYLLGFSINVVTLLALSLVIGILVDDAIVEVENIVRHLRMGKSPYQAAMEAADEIGLAVIATTFTLIAVFLPTAFMSGVAGKFFKQFGWTASLAVFASLVVARVLTPMMAAYILKPIVTGHQEPGWMKTYLRMADLVHEAPLSTMVMATLFFFGSIALIPLLPTGFIPPDDNSQTQVYLELPPGSTLAQTLASAEQARADDRQSGACEERVHHHRRRQRRRRPVCHERRGRSAQGHADHPAGRAQRPAAQAGHREQHPRRAGAAARRAQQGGPGRLGRKYVLVLTGEDPTRCRPPPSRWRKTCAPSRAWAGGVHRQPDPPRDCGAPRLCTRRRPGRDQRRHRRDAAHCHPGRLRRGLAKLNLSQRQVPIVVKLADDAAQGPGRAGAPDRARHARPGDAGPGGHAGADRRAGGD